MKKKVLVSHNLYREGFAELEKHFDVVYPEGDFFTFEQALVHLPEVYAIIPTFTFKVTREIIDAAPNLKIIANYGAGYDNIDWKYAAEKGIVVTNAPDPVTEPTGEQAFALMLALARRTAENDRKLREGRVHWGVMYNLGTTLHRKTLGIVGMGKIGKVVARYATGAEMSVLYNNRNRLPEDVEKQYNAKWVPFDELVRESDYISLNTPMNDATKHLFSDKEFAAMKKSAFIVNCARGPVIDEKALIRALQNKEIAGAGLDVFENEPNIPAELLAMDNVVVAPHTGTSTVETRHAMAAFASQNVIRFSQGRTDITKVN